jgi:hypothetical protein
MIPKRHWTVWTERITVNTCYPIIKILEADREARCFILTSKSSGPRRVRFIYGGEDDKLRRPSHEITLDIRDTRPTDVVGKFQYPPPVRRATGLVNDGTTDGPMFPMPTATSGSSTAVDDCYFSHPARRGTNLVEPKPRIEVCPERPQPSRADSSDK